MKKLPKLPKLLISVIHSDTAYEFAQVEQRAGASAQEGVAAASLLG